MRLAALSARLPKVSRLLDVEDPSHRPIRRARGPGQNDVYQPPLSVTLGCGQARTSGFGSRRVHFQLRERGVYHAYRDIGSAEPSGAGGLLDLR